MVEQIEIAEDGHFPFRPSCHKHFDKTVKHFRVYIEEKSEDRQGSVTSQ